MRSLRLLARRGQIVIPALFIFPSLMLFVYLIYETAKLSREKIRRQFAVDAAAFVEMTNYSDFLNRTAYVNGAFPARIFYEGFWETNISCDKKIDNCPPSGYARSSGSGVPLDELLYNDCDFPRLGPSGVQPSDTDLQWRIRYNETKCKDLNDSPPDIDAVEAKTESGVQTFQIITQQDVHNFWLNWDDANQIYKLYVQIYQLLGSVEEAQYNVLKRLSANQNFFKKSYWLNTGDPIGDAEDGARSFRLSSGNFLSAVKFFCHHRVTFYGNKPDPSNTFQPWKEFAPENPIDMNYLQSCVGGAGLFKIAWVPQREVDRMRNPGGSPYPGYPVVQHWKAPVNYFNYDFNQNVKELGGGRPWVHTTVSCGVNNPKASVWPDPTPKFQVRTYP